MRSRSNSHDIKEGINRLVEPHRYQRRTKPKAPADRPAIKGAVGVGERVPPNTDPAN